MNEYKYQYGIEAAVAVNLGEKWKKGRLEF